jgi:hypothetical protein
VVDDLTGYRFRHLRFRNEHTLFIICHVTQVGELRRMIASSRDLPSDRLKLVLRGKTLHDKKSGDSIEDATVRLSPGGL